MIFLPFGNSFFIFYNFEIVEVFNGAVDIKCTIDKSNFEIFQTNNEKMDS